ncbi:hypothetical protein RE628_10985 [Paenibacillus sp. D2_2]|uniref:PspA/IM30 family protein n=1 Tax=Paenibacillus sp. D2_2 TaxID=3073092 RepID=UPI002815A7F0|nr:hypothetical protein [Paenibacillus sp. D2_2]WMT42764.1 hypothetical protein RE628_10985 [Paenibacillus sp. D2_2]
MSFFKREQDLTKYDYNNTGSEAVDLKQLEDNCMDYSCGNIEDQNEVLLRIQAELEDTERELAGRITLEGKFKQLYVEQQAFVNRRIRQAHMGAMAHQEDYARRALTEKRLAEAKMKEYLASYELYKAEAEQLRDKFAHLLGQLEAMEQERGNLVGNTDGG